MHTHRRINSPFEASAHDGERSVGPSVPPIQDSPSRAGAWAAAAANGPAGARYFIHSLAKTKAERRVGGLCRDAHMTTHHGDRAVTDDHDSEHTSAEETQETPCPLRVPTPRPPMASSLVHACAFGAATAESGSDERFCRRYNQRKHLEKVAQEIAAALSGPQGTVKIVLSTRPPSEAAQSANESLEHQRFHGLVRLSLHGPGVPTCRPAVICTLNSKELVLLGGPELQTKLLTVPRAHIDVRTEAGLDHVFSIGFARNPELWNQIQSARLKGNRKYVPTSEQPDTRVFLPLSNKSARDSWLEVLVRFKVATIGWTSSTSCGSFSSSESDSKPDFRRVQAALDPSAEYIQQLQEVQSTKIQMDRDFLDNIRQYTFAATETPPNLGCGIHARGRRLALNNALPLVIWLPE